MKLMRKEEETRVIHELWHSTPYKVTTCVKISHMCEKFKWQIISVSYEQIVWQSLSPLSSLFKSTVSSVQLTEL